MAARVTTPRTGVARAFSGPHPRVGFPGAAPIWPSVLPQLCHVFDTPTPNSPSSQLLSASLPEQSFLVQSPPKEKLGLWSQGRAPALELAVLG